MRILQNGDSSIVIEVSRRVSSDTIAQAERLAVLLRSTCPANVTDIAATYASVIICYRAYCHDDIDRWLEQSLATASNVAPSNQIPNHSIEIPVCYCAEFGPDLTEIAEQSGRSGDDLVELHAKAAYTVGAIGFMPGFTYLLGLPDLLHTPRRVEPRPRVPAGSVGIGAMQCGIYPAESPGGWNLIGRTPLRLFNPAATPAALLAVGMTVQFKPITRREFDRWR